MDTTTILLLVVAAVAVAVLAPRLVRSVTVYEYETGLRYRRGRFAGAVGPGRYLLFAPFTRLISIDRRPTVTTVPGQEVITADGVSLRVSLTAEHAVEDPVLAVHGHEDFRAALYAALQVALRDAVAAAEVDELLSGRAEVGPALLERVREPAAALGVRLVRVEMKDIMLAGDLRRAFAQAVTARKEGLAALERARGETAALRNLANAARMMEGNPGLMQLRLLQELGRTGGNTMVVGLPGGTTPLPLRGGEAAATDEPPELPPQAG